MKRRIPLVFLLLAFAFAPLPALSQDGSTHGGTTDTLGSPSSAAGLSFLPLPIIFYTPETGIAGGAALLIVERVPDQLTRPSSLMLDMIYTQRKQIIVEAYPILHLGGGTYHLLGAMAFSRYPQKFYGIGNSTPDSLEELYTSRTARFGLDALRTVVKHVDLGFSVYFEERALTDLDPQGSLVSKTIPGSDGGTTLGLGVIARWDTRDNEFAPLGGRFYQFTWRKASPALGSDFDFTHMTADLREYIRTGEASVLGAQLLATSVTGHAPFYLLARLGGASSMRGYYEGRYRDMLLLAGQVEYRFPLIWRIRGSAFVGIGDVAPTLSGFALRTVKPTYGFGIRYVFDPLARLNVRFDMGFGRDASGVYMTVHEAF
jgi:hypothetical protein